MRRELALVVMLGACGAPPTPAACPSGTQTDAARAGAIEARLATAEEGRALLHAARAGVSAVCFGAPSSASVITSEHVVILAGDLEEGEAAARLGHLLVHVRDGLPVALFGAGQGAASCDEAVDHALALEARAYVVEIALQAALDAHPRALAFELADTLRTAPEAARESLALAYLRAHPDGAPGIDGLASAYRALCRR